MSINKDLLCELVLGYWKLHPEVKTVRWIQAKTEDIDDTSEEYKHHISEESDQEDVPGKSSQGDSEGDRHDSEESSDGNEDDEDVNEQNNTLGENKFAALVEDD